ncbi:MAG: enoyl-CoA hydratase/isomerase family protein [Gammaproteobacteria bacterium]|nr:MAG: enoyl-CoA hydratase/isomerase family protein [Gammaproteobacteria bacterium]TDJ45074.1 MAG: enoyl-CoA hydratase/isomerase family protein [Gammaproteobacteria bacterium]
MSEPVYTEVQDTVATVVLNRPEKLNALDLPDWVRIGELIGELHENEAVRCVVIRGVNAKAFSAGADITGFAQHRSTKSQVRAYGEIIESSLTAIRHCRHPVIAAINGVCVGGGLELSSACDIRICGASSRFGAPINRLGLTMSYAEVATLKDIAGTAGALEILLGGNVFDATRAYELGLVSQVTPDGELLETAYALARRIAERAPLVNRWHKKFIRRLANPAPLTTEEIDEGYAAYDTEDYRIGYEAFLEKKQPDFKGR